MPRAKCVLTRGPRTHTVKNRTFKRGESQTLTTDHEINYYRSTYGFTVTMLEGDKKEKTAKKTKKRIFTEEELFAKKKTKLVTMAEKHQVLLTGREKKPELVEAILAAQDFED